MLHLIACHGRIMPRLAELLYYESITFAGMSKKCLLYHEWQTVYTLIGVYTVC